MAEPAYVGALRDDASGPMHVVSDPVGDPNRQRVHFQAPATASLPLEMERFLAWANGTPQSHHSSKPRWRTCGWRRCTRLTMPMVAWPAPWVT